jgi:hypothetical protein
VLCVLELDDELAILCRLPVSVQPASQQRQSVRVPQPDKRKGKKRKVSEIKCKKQKDDALDSRRHAIERRFEIEHLLSDREVLLQGCGRVHRNEARVLLRGAGQRELERHGDDVRFEDLLRAEPIPAETEKTIRLLSKTVSFLCLSRACLDKQTRSLSF